MSNNIVLKFLMQEIESNKIKYTEEDLLLFEAINESIVEMQTAQSLFNSVSDPNLIDLAIHTEDVAKSRYNFLIGLAKERSLRKID
ncbi:DUF2508 family protein [Clostridium sp.]|uniref:DUF2508 family protein n=1 Tax=Clostridium sp. TaxID=1506 RepID=UPI002611AE00|nr:DUF2508 family protein [Clostridium sp.]